jgi:hypothetical protein
VTVKLDLPNLVEETDRHGNMVLYVRKKADGRTKRVRLRSAPGAPAFLTEYQAALDALNAAGAALKVAPRKQDDIRAASLGWLRSNISDPRSSRASPRSHRISAAATSPAV